MQLQVNCWFNLSCYYIILANCGNPTDWVNNSYILVEYKEPTVEGTKVNFSCHPEYEPKGLLSAECMSNGEWVPDPKELEINCSGQ